MAKQKLNGNQIQMEVNGVMRTLTIKYGTGTMTLTGTGERDNSWDTGVAKFPNELIAGGITENWQNTTWTYTLDAWRVQQGTTNIVVSLHTAETTANTSLNLKWWAIGY